MQITEQDVAAGAEVIAASPLIDAPRLPATAWHGLSRAVLEAAESGVGHHWLKSQIIEAHKALTAMGVPDRETRRDWNRGTMRMEDKEFSLGVSDRIAWLRANWQPKPKS